MRPAAGFGHDRAVTAARLSLRALNRATLERQLLLERTSLPVLDAVAHLVGLQAQVPLNPYLGLWSRLRGFDPADLALLLEDRTVVRIVVMRGTLHLVTADDCLVLRPLAQPVLDRELANHADHAGPLRGIDLGPVLGAARGFLDQPRSGPELRAFLADRFPHDDPAALAYACRNHLALVQAPPRGVWGRSGGIRNVTAEAWLGRPLEPMPSIDDVVVRYLAAYGPASVADAATWSGLTGMREVLERLRPRLRTFLGPTGRELFDVPDGPHPDPDVPAPARFLPEYDNVLLSHADRSRFVSEDDRRRLYANPRTVKGSVLHDGLLAATWAVEDGDLVVSHVAPLTKKAVAAITAEGRRMLRFLAGDGDGDGDVRFARLG